MRIQLTILLVLLLIISVYDAISQHRQLWISGYIASWSLNMTGIPGGAGAANYGNQIYSTIDLDAMTHLFAFTAGLDSIGSMSVKKEWDSSLTWGGSLLANRRKPFNDYVHSKGKCILLTIFGAGNGGDWTKMVADPTSRNNAVKTIVDSVIFGDKYDGVDFDLEPLDDSDTANSRIFFAQLYDTLQKYHAWHDTTKKPLMTAPVYNYDTFWASVEPYFSQINIMTYDMFGTWCTKVWHNCPVFAGGAKDIYGNTLASVQNKTQRYIGNGVPRSKVGIGIGMNGHEWKGGRVNRGGDTTNGILYPLDQWMDAYPPTKFKYGETMYYELFQKYIDTATTTLCYDSIRKVPYISIDNPGNLNDTYVTFADTSTMRELVILADTMNIGGAILWDVCSAWLNLTIFPDTAHLPGGMRDPLLQAVKRAMNNNVTKVELNINISPKYFQLGQNFPNPFNPSTIIPYSVFRRAKVKLNIFNILGQRIATLIEEEKEAGPYQVEFNPDQLTLASGVYFYRLEANGVFNTKKMLFLK